MNTSSVFLYIKIVLQIKKFKKNIFSNVAIIFICSHYLIAMIFSLFRHINCLTLSDHSMARANLNRIQWLVLNMADSKKLSFSTSPKAEQFSPKFHRLVLGIVGLIDAKGINVTQTVLLSGCPM